MIAALLVVAAASAGGTAVAEPTPDPAPPPPPAPKSSIDADGTFAVNTDIVPGNYSSAGPVGDGACYWRRMDAEGTTLDNAITKKPQIVSIAPGDASFRTSGCQPWQLTDQAPDAQMPPALAGLKMQGYLAMINGMAAMAGPVPEKTPDPLPDTHVPAGAPGPGPDPALPPG